MRWLSEHGSCLVPRGISEFRRPKYGTGIALAYQLLTIRSMAGAFGFFTLIQHFALPDR